jgi:hypothetical protein
MGADVAMRDRAREVSRLDPPVSYAVQPSPLVGGRGRPLEATIVLVDCGGTGGFLAESLCRLLVGIEASVLYIVDPDRVEPRNLARQTFAMADVGHFKLRSSLSDSLVDSVGKSATPSFPTSVARTPRSSRDRPNWR